MSYEEKYKGALEIIKGNLEALNEISETGAEVVNIQSIKNCFYRAFSELRESEDELTWLTKYIEEEAQSLSMDIRDNEDRITLKKLQKALTWLEKQSKVEQAMREVEEKAEAFTQAHKGETSDEILAQMRGEQKPANKVEPKFHEGDWVILTAGELSITLQIVNVDTNKKLYWFNDSSYLPIVDEECLHLWTIQDVKDGDMLQLGKVTAIFKEFIGNEHCECYCSVYNGEFDIPSQDDADNSYGCHNAIPATKEQRDALMKAMADEGWEFDFEKKELKEIEIESETEIPFGAEDSELQEVTYYIPKGFHAEIDDDKVVIKKGEKPTAWSEEDEERLQRICKLHLRFKKGYGATILQIEEDIAWLKVLKNRVQSQNFTVTNKELVQAKKNAYNDALNKIE